MKRQASENERYLASILPPDQVRAEGLDDLPEEVRVGNLILRDPLNPELGFKQDKEENLGVIGPPIVEPVKLYDPAVNFGAIPVRMSLTDGMPIPLEAPESAPEALPDNV